MLYCKQMKSITDTERQAIQKKEIKEFEQKELRGTGYRLMHERDRGWGFMQDITGKEVVVEWHIDEVKREDGKAYRNVPEGHFVLRAGKEEIILDKEVFHKILRWV